MTRYEAPELITMGESTHIVRQSGSMSAETACGCGHWLFFDGDPLNADEEVEEDHNIGVASDATDQRSLQL
jgi:hypothetical protein